EAFSSQRRQPAEPSLIRATVCRLQVSQCHWIEVVVGEKNETKPLAPKRDDFANNGTDIPLPRLLPIGSPNRAERAVLGTSTNSLHRTPHVPITRQQIPSCRRERFAGDATA